MKKPMPLDVLNLEGLPPIWFRPKTSDEYIIAANLNGKTEYEFPEFEPKVIFDVGANIGIVSVVMANLYPDAQIFAYEPNPENFFVLEKNTEAYPNIHRACVALCKEDGMRAMFHTDEASNFGGCSLFEPGTDAARGSFDVVARAVASEVDRVGGAVDLIKIDAEGSEFEVLNSLTTEQRRKVQFIVGELHGTKDFDTLALLEPDFHLSFAKPLRSRVFHFHAQRIKENGVT